MTVWPSASVAASIAFSVPITDTNGNRISVPRRRPGCRREVVAVAVLDVGAERPHRLDVEVDRPPPDPVAAGVADDHPAEPGEERPSSMKLARIFAAASSGTKSHSTSPEATS